MMTSAKLYFGLLAFAAAAACSGGVDPSIYSRPDRPSDEQVPPSEPHDPFDIQSGVTNVTVSASTAMSSSGAGGGCSTCADVYNGMATMINPCPNSQAPYSALLMCLCTTSICNAAAGGGGGAPCAMTCPSLVPNGVTGACQTCSASECNTEQLNCLNN